MAQQNEQWIIKIERNLRESEEKFSQPTKQHGNCIGVIPGAHGLERYTHTHSPVWGALTFSDQCNIWLTLQLGFTLSDGPRRFVAKITETRAFLIPMVMPAAPVARNRVILPESEKCLLLLGFSVCNLTFNGFLRGSQCRHGSCRQPFPKRGRGPIHVTDFVMKERFGPTKAEQTEAHGVCMVKTPSAAHSLLNMSARHAAARGEADVYAP